MLSNSHTHAARAKDDLQKGLQCGVLGVVANEPTRGEILQAKRKKAALWARLAAFVRTTKTMRRLRHLALAAVVTTGIIHTSAANQARPLRREVKTDTVMLVQHMRWDFDGEKVTRQVVADTIHSAGRDWREYRFNENVIKIIRVDTVGKSTAISR